MKKNKAKLYCIDCIKGMKKLPDNCIDTIITDPPYNLKFMGKKWDSLGTAFQVEVWEEALRVMKPGAMLFAFGGTRTSHRLTCAIEDAGLEIRDCLMWLYGSGFPKSHDISKAIDKQKGVKGKIAGKNISIQFIERGYKYRGNAKGSGYGNEKKFGFGCDVTAPATPEAQQWIGFGTALKPAYEPIILAMKSLDGTFAENALKWGVAGLNIDAGRIVTNDDRRRPPRTPNTIYGNGMGTNLHASENNPKGRWPANLVLDEEAAKLLDEQVPFTSKTGKRKDSLKGYHQPPGGEWFGRKNHNGAEYQDSGGASRFFYVAKAPKRERGEGNTHPTVKPIKLLEYLCKLSRPQKKPEALCLIHLWGVVRLLWPV